MVTDTSTTSTTNTTSTTSTTGTTATSSTKHTTSTTINARGKLLLDYLACANLTLLNGCVLGDIMGELTSVNYNGSSVVDYADTSQELRRLVKNFKVQNLNVLLTKHYNTVKN